MGWTDNRRGRLPPSKSALTPQLKNWRNGLACYGGAGFEPGLAGGQDRDSRVALIGLGELYAGLRAGEGEGDGVR